MKKYIIWFLYSAVACAALTGAWWATLRVTPKEPALKAMDDWNIRVYAPDDRTKVKSETMAWRLIDGKNVCYLFLQRNAETWIPTTACK